MVKKTNLNKLENRLIMQKHEAIHGPIVKGDALAKLKLENEALIFEIVSSFATGKELPVDDIKRNVALVFTFKHKFQEAYKIKEEEFQTQYRNITYHDKAKLWYACRKKYLDEAMELAVKRYYSELKRQKERESEYMEFHNRFIEEEKQQEAYEAKKQEATHTIMHAAKVCDNCTENYDPFIGSFCPACEEKRDKLASVI